MGEAARFFGGFAIAAVIFIGGLLSLVNYGERVSCHNTAAVMGAEWHYSFTTPCMIKMEGKPWMPLHSYRVVN
jgi:hypothetical protein